MINRIKHKNKLLIIILLMITICCQGQDTTIRKKYFDSLKSQLAAYTISSYTHLNMYDRCENDRLAKDAKIASFDNAMFIKKKRNTRAIVYIVVAALMSNLIIYVNTTK